jgi:hypothetical protein
MECRCQPNSIHCSFDAAAHGAEYVLLYSHGTRLLTSLQPLVSNTVSNLSLGWRHYLQF